MSCSAAVVAVSGRSLHEIREGFNPLRDGVVAVPNIFPLRDQDHIASPADRCDQRRVLLGGAREIEEEVEHNCARPALDETIDECRVKRSGPRQGQAELSD